jgi:hypothetical protein
MDSTPTGRRRLREVGGRIEDRQSLRLPFGVMPGLTIMIGIKVRQKESLDHSPGFALGLKGERDTNNFVCVPPSWQVNGL